MIMFCIYGLPVLGLLVLALEILVWLSNCRHKRPVSIPIKAWSVIAGMFLAAAGFFIRYPVGHTYKVYGFPFSVRVFELVPPGWVDYAAGNDFPAVAILLNALVLGLLPQFWLRKRLGKAA